MSTQVAGPSYRGLRLLSIDGGGIRGLSALLILKEVLYRIQQKLNLTQLPRPCEVFHLAGGTGTGGIIVILLFRLRLSIDDAIKAYVDFAKFVFSEKQDQPLGGAIFKSSMLEHAITSIIRVVCKLEAHQAQNLRMLDKDGPKCFVCATPLRNMATPKLFRSWMPTSNPSYDCTIVEASRATTANMPIFNNIEFGDHVLKDTFIGGSWRCINPILYVLQEATSVFENPRFSCVLSIGMGLKGVIGMNRSNGVTNGDLIEALERIATDCEGTSENTARAFANTKGIYYRLNVEQGLQGIDKEDLSAVQSLTRQYLSEHEVDRKLDLLVQALIKSAVSATVTVPPPPPTELSSIEQQAFMELKKSISINAGHDSQTHSTLGCLPGTRREQIVTIMTWIETQDSKQPLFIVLGPSGSGKSTLLWTIARICKDKGSYAAGFFFSGTDPERNKAARLINTIAYQISEAIPELRPYISREVQEEGSILTHSLQSQLTNLLLRPLSQLQSDHPTFSFRTSVIIVDALDECGSNQDQLEVISVLTAALSHSSFPFLCILSSRCDLHIENAFSFRLTRPLIHTRIILGQAGAVENQDILAYLNENTRDIRSKHPFRAQLPHLWPAKSDLELIVERSCGQFIYAATAIRYIESPLYKPQDCLQYILNISPLKSGANPFASVDDLYRMLMFSVVNLETAMEILGIEFVRSSSRFWTPGTLENGDFFKEHFDSLGADVALAPLAPVLKCKNSHIKLYHLSFAEFLLDSARSLEFFVHPVKWQKWIVSRLAQSFYEGKGISMADIGYLIREAKPGTELHQLISTGLELVIDNPTRLPGGRVFNIWPFVAWRFFWELQFWISVEKLATVFLQRDNCLSLPVLIKLAPTHKLSNSFLLFELCRTIALLENIGFITDKGIRWPPDQDPLLLCMTYLVDYFDGQSRSDQSILLPEDYHCATLRCLWYLQTPRRDICLSLKEHLHSLEWLPAQFGIPRYLKGTSNNVTRGALEVLPSLLLHSPPSIALLSSLKQPFDNEVILMNPSSSRNARHFIHEYLTHHDAEYRGCLFEEINNPQEDEPLPDFNRYLVEDYESYNLVYERWSGWDI